MYKTACSFRRSQENRNVFSPKSKLLSVPIHFWLGKLFADHFVFNSKLSSERCQAGVVDITPSTATTKCCMWAEL